MSRFFLTFVILSAVTSQCIAQFRLIHGCGSYGCEPGNSGSTLLPLPYGKPDVQWTHSMARDKIEHGCGHHQLVPYTQGCISQESYILCSAPRVCMGLDGQWAGHIGFSTDGQVLFHLNNYYAGSGFCGTDSSYSSVPGQSGVMSNAGDVILWSPQSVAYTSFGSTIWGVPINPNIQCGYKDFVSEVLGDEETQSDAGQNADIDYEDTFSEECAHCHNTNEDEYLMLPADKMSHVTITNTSRVLFYVSTEGQVFGYATNAVPIAEIFLKSNSTRSDWSDLKLNGYPIFPSTSSPSSPPDVDSFHTERPSAADPSAFPSSVGIYYPATGTLVPIAEQLTVGSRTLYIARYYETVDRSVCSAPDGIRPCIIPSSQLVFTAMDMVTEVLGRLRLPWQRPIFDENSAEFIKKGNPSEGNNNNNNNSGEQTIGKKTPHRQNEPDLNSLGPVIPLPKELEECVPAYSGYFSGTEPLVISGPLLLADGATVVFGLSCVKKFQPPYVSNRKKYPIDDGRSFRLENSTYPDQAHTTSTYLYAYTVMEPHENVPELLWMTKIDAAELRKYLHAHSHSPLNTNDDIGPGTSLTLDAGAYARLANWYNHRDSLYNEKKDTHAFGPDASGNSRFQASGTNAVPLLSGAFWITFPSVGALVNVNDKGKILHVASIRSLLQTAIMTPSDVPTPDAEPVPPSNPSMRASRAPSDPSDSSTSPGTFAHASCKLTDLFHSPSNYKDLDFVFTTRPLASPASARFSAPDAAYYHYHETLKLQAEEEAELGMGGEGFSFYENAPTPGMYEVDSSETVIVASLLVVPKYCSSSACSGHKQSPSSSTKTVWGAESKGSIHSSWIVGVSVDTHLEADDDLILQLSQTTSKLLWCVEMPSTDGSFEPEIATGQLGIVRHDISGNAGTMGMPSGNTTQTRIVVGTRKGFVSLG